MFEQSHWISRALAVRGLSGWLTACALRLLNDLRLGNAIHGPDPRLPPPRPSARKTSGRAWVALTARYWVPVLQLKTFSRQRRRVLSSPLNFPDFVGGVMNHAADTQRQVSPAPHLEMRQARQVKYRQGRALPSSRRAPVPRSKEPRHGRFEHLAFSTGLAKIGVRAVAWVLGSPPATAP